MPQRFISHDIPDSWKHRDVFEIRGRRFPLREVVLASEIRGDLEPLIAESRRALACEQRAADEGREADLEAVEAMMDGFRYEHGLVSVEETEHWLEGFGLEVDDLGGYFLREYWKRELGAEVEPPVDSIDGDSATWPCDLILSGGLERLARRLAREATCAVQRTGPSDALARELLDGFRSSDRMRDIPFGPWMAAWEVSEATVLSHLFGQWCQAADRRDALTSERRAAALAEQRSALVRVELVSVQFDSEAAAHEAYLCVTADGLALEAVADEAGYPLRRTSAFVRQFPEEWHLPLLSAHPGRTLPPLPDSGTYQVCRVVTQHEPILTDPAVAEALDALLLERHFGRLESREVNWLQRTEVAE
ncbi:MAG: hypothetical protein JNL10_12455 [Verrucomicrobiales bacterium]|nr:hypothetical protein [Verrucomicrobiales bacterium]